MLGAAAGDALGWPQEQRSGIVGGQRSRQVEPKFEFRSWTRWAGTQFSRYEDPVAAGEYSDDTQLLLATGRACLRGEDWLRWLTDVELPAWPLYQRGGGRAVLKACHSWSSQTAPWDGSAESVASYFSAGANGVAMRIAPHVLATIGDPTTRRLIGRITQDGITTHGHTRALVGAVVYSLALRYTLRRQGTMEYGDLITDLLQSPAWEEPDAALDVLSNAWLQKFKENTGCGFRESWLLTAREMRDLLAIVQNSLNRAALADDEATLASLGCFDKKVNGSGTVTAAGACYLAARFAVRPSMGLLRSAFLSNADTDTLASMTGALLGALHGSEWLESLLPNLQDCEYIKTVSENLLNSQLQGFELPSAPQRLDSKKWLRDLPRRDAYDTFADGRRVTETQKVELKSSSKQLVTRLRFSLSDGQQVIIDRKERQGGSLERTVNRQTKSENAHEQLQEMPTIATRVAVHVSDLGETRRFYSEVLGIEVGGSDQVVRLSPWLAFLQHPLESAKPMGAPIQITVSSPDTARVKLLVDKNQVSIAPRGPQDVADSLRVVDPDGNEVLVWPSKNISQ
ncbi:ADP-ribosylglycohydrolase family protein (plasmid) [Streptomyces sp. NBC_01220]|uniref:ADP-ribosylglycohydrolase family protein n=1 Tax=Streptomyces sp. NBC_01220 TaxID=2903781 RepID=UPI002F9077B5|nr:ADP-ribosylglycohydrolase family protein [Streptomyces sp. NBC_01220]